MFKKLLKLLYPTVEQIKQQERKELTARLYASHCNNVSVPNWKK